MKDTVQAEALRIANTLTLFNNECCDAAVLELRRLHEREESLVAEVQALKEWQALARIDFSNADAKVIAMQPDAERYRWLRDYLISDRTEFDDSIVDALTKEELDAAIDAASTTEETP